MTLQVTDLRVHIAGLMPVDRVTFSLDRGHTLGIVGESGSGKTLTALSIIGLQPDVASVDGCVQLDDLHLLELTERGYCEVRGTRISMMFQDALTALNPLMRIGDQIRECLPRELRRRRDEADAEILRLLEILRLRDPVRAARAYPHQLSGGERQRVLVGMALAGNPQLVIADEPTTALDSVLRVSILRLLRDLTCERGQALIVITHDLAVVASLCQDVAVMYGGHIVEYGPRDLVLRAPRHRYTAALLGAMPTIDVRRSPGRPRRLPTVRGVVPALGQFPSGCVFRDRCDFADDVCLETPPRAFIDDRAVSCWHPVPGNP